MISIFKRKTTCGYIRGAQIAKAIEARLNPSSGYENDTCIYVKIRERGGRKQYLDLLDQHEYIARLRKNSDLSGIAISRVAEDYLKNEVKNEIVFIPQQHCNFGNQKRPEREVKVVGWCGARGCFEMFESEFREKLKGVGLELRAYYGDQYKKRHDIINFYLGIDIQIVWRNQAEWNYMLKNPLKISNAGSFGIPTISRPEPCAIAEYGGCFVEAQTIDDAVGCAEQLKNNSALYSDIAGKACEKAKEYHILKISERYKALDT